MQADADVTSLVDSDQAERDIHACPVKSKNAADHCVGLVARNFHARHQFAAAFTARCILGEALVWRDLLDTSMKGHIRLLQGDARARSVAEQPLWQKRRPGFTNTTCSRTCV